MDTDKNERSPLATGVWPAFKAIDARRLIDWLSSALGFTENVVYKDGDRIAHAQLDWPSGGGIMLGDVDPTGNGWERQPGTSGTYLVSQDVDRLYEQALTAGATVVRELTEQDYGSREFTVADPEGNLWSVGTYPGEPRKEHDGGAA